MMPRIDATRWPIVEIVFGDTITFDDITDFEAALLRILKEQGPMVVVSDISALKAGEVTALHRKKVAEMADRLGAQGGIIAEVVIIKSPLLRALYAGYSWARKRSDYPSEAIGDRTAAFVWARKHAMAARPRAAR